MEILRLSDSVMQKLNMLVEGLLHAFPKAVLEEQIAVAYKSGSCKGCSGSCQGSCSGNCDGVCLIQ
jgi:hypothetical protein